MKYESYINYTSYDGTGQRIFSCQEIQSIDYLEFLPEFPWVKVVFQMPDELTTTITNIRIVGEPGTYVYYKSIKYETKEDYYKLQQVVEREKIQDMLNNMDKG